MVKKSKKRTVKKKVEPKKEVQPSYNVMVDNPHMIRKDLLESLKEIILFMKDYEIFEQLQEEKILAMEDLREEIKKINMLVNTKLKKYFPKGKLREITSPDEFEKIKEGIDEEEPVEVVIKKKPVIKGNPEKDLNDLENELKTIEEELRNFD
jgi:hypothetical protein